mgnify:CR=1 FL=1
MHYFSNYAMDTLNWLRIECTAARAMDLKRELDQAGLVVNQDYTWRYQKPVYDEFAWTDSEPSHATFTFQNPAMATFYQLKWAR